MRSACFITSLVKAAIGENSMLISMKKFLRKEFNHIYDCSSAFMEIAALSTFDTGQLAFASSAAV